MKTNADLSLDRLALSGILSRHLIITAKDFQLWLFVNFT